MDRHKNGTIWVGVSKRDFRVPTSTHQEPTYLACTDAEKPTLGTYVQYCSKIQRPSLREAFNEALQRGMSTRKPVEIDIRNVMLICIFISE